MIASIQKVLLYKNKSTSIVFGLVGGVYGYYKGVLDYDEYINKQNVEKISKNEINNTFEKKIILSTLTYGGIFGLIGIYPVITLPIISSLYTYDKYLK
jgi:hypothetical protein